MDLLRSIVLFLLTVGSVYAQQTNYLHAMNTVPPQSALPPIDIGNGTPTNLAGFPAYSWYVVNATWQSSPGKLPNLTSTGSSLDLTNPVAGSTPTLYSGMVNGKDSLGFDGVDDYLENVNTAMVVDSRGAEIWMVVQETNDISGTQYWWAGTNGITGGYTGFDRIYENFGSQILGSGGRITNKWFTVAWVGTNGAALPMILTNNVLLKAGTSGTNAVKGLTVGINYNFTQPIHAWIAEIATYNTNLSTAARSNLFKYFTNRYAITL